MKMQVQHVKSSPVVISMKGGAESVWKKSMEIQFFFLEKNIPLVHLKRIFNVPNPFISEKLHQHSNIPSAPLLLLVVPLTELHLSALKATAWNIHACLTSLLNWWNVFRINSLRVQIYSIRGLSKRGHFDQPLKLWLHRPLCDWLTSFLSTSGKIRLQCKIWRLWLLTGSYKCLCPFSFLKIHGLSVDSLIVHKSWYPRVRLNSYWSDNHWCFFHKEKNQSTL